MAALYFAAILLHHAPVENINTSAISFLAATLVAAL